VVNEGWPGRNSRELLETLGAQLQRHAPAVVCILVGVNDTWSRPRQLEAGAEDAGQDDRGLELRWRTGRLLALCLAALTGGEQTTQQVPSLLGSWAMIHRRIDFATGGRGNLDGRPMTWRQEGPWLEVHCPDTFHVVARLQGDDRAVRLVSTDAGAPEVVLERLENMVDGRIAAARRAIVEANQAFASTLLAPVLAATRDDDVWAVRLHRAARGVTAATGDVDLAQVHADWLLAHGQALDASVDPGSSETLDGTLEGVLSDHLRRSIALCRRRGTVPILVTYPYEWAFLSVHARVADELGVTLVEAGPKFVALARADPGARLFVADGHCSDLGYAHLAELVGSAVARALAARPH